MNYDLCLSRLIEGLVPRHGLVEFRARIDSLPSRLDDNNLEVALFGRASSGKCSLLHTLLSTNILPVGINPITAVPTKLRYGAELRADVAFAGGREETVSIDELPKAGTELGNPGNLRNILRAVVELPSPRLLARLICLVQFEQRRGDNFAVNFRLPVGQRFWAFGFDPFCPFIPEFG